MEEHLVDDLLGDGMGKKPLQCHYWGASTRFRFGWVPSFCAASGSIESPPVLTTTRYPFCIEKKKKIFQLPMVCRLNPIFGGEISFLILKSQLFGELRSPSLKELLLRGGR
jgi:hypothetical protein